jgi:hypothetical protein
MKFDYYQIPTGQPDRPYKYLPLIPLKIFNQPRDKFLLGQVLPMKQTSEILGVSAMTLRCWDKK